MTWFINVYVRPDGSQLLSDTNGRRRAFSPYLINCLGYQPAYRLKVIEK